MVTSSRDQLTQKILAQKLRLNLRWADIANLLGRSKEWTTAACLGQMQMNKPQAEAIRDVFLLNDEECAWLQSAPYKSSNSIPSDPCLYRFYEAIGVYGPALKELIHEEFGDGIMSAVDFTIHVDREQHDVGDRVRIIWSGKFLPYRQF